MYGFSLLPIFLFAVKYSPSSILSSWLIAVMNFVNAKSTVFISCGACVFFAVYPTTSEPVTVFSYPVGTFFSSTLYVIICPFAFNGKPVNLCFQLLSLFNVIVSTSSLFAYNVILTESGLILS